MSASTSDLAGRFSAPLRSRVFSVRSLVIVIALALALVFVPVLASIYWTKVLTVSVIYAIAAAGIGLLYGRLGLVSLSQVAMIGVGAWITLRIGHATGLPFELVLLLAGIGTCVVGVLVGLPALRLSGLNLAIVTLMVAGAFQVIFNAINFPDGGPGFFGVMNGSTKQIPLARPGLGQTDPQFFRYVVVVAILMFLVFAVSQSSKPGRAWAAIRQSEAGALAAGVNTTNYKLLALAVASFTTGIAGGLLAVNTGLLDSVSFQASESILLFATSLIGGVFSLAGAIIAGLFSQALPALLNSWGINGNLIFLLLGLGMIQAITTIPHGVVGELGRLGRWVRRRLFAPRKQGEDG